MEIADEAAQRFDLERPTEKYRLPRTGSNAEVVLHVSTPACVLSSYA